MYGMLKWIVLAVLGLGLVWLVYGLLTMTDPSTGPHPEPSPALVGSGEVPETTTVPVPETTTGPVQP